jgi:hypothetical protein
MKKYLDKYLIEYFVLAFLVLLVASWNQYTLTGWVNIMTHPSLLLTDYLAVGGLSATLLNVLIILIANLYLIKKLNIKFSGGIYAALLTIIGFSFFGKTIINIIPIYLGVFLYAYIKKIKMKQVILFAMFGTGIAPIVSFIMFGLSLPLLISIPLGVIAGVLIGIIIPPISSHVIKFHMGYALYNVGFAVGIIGLFVGSFFKAIQVDVQGYMEISNDYHNQLLGILISYSLITFIFGLYKNGYKFTGYGKLIKKSGRAVTNFDALFSKEINYINIGLIGLICIGFLLVYKIPVNGPVFGGAMTVLAFSTFGKHPRNVVPVMLGLSLMALILGLDITLPGFAIALFFVTALAPIAGQYGFIVGMLAGALHLIVVMSSSSIHSGFVLYNNGFAAGFTAAVLVAVLDTIFVKE